MILKTLRVILGFALCILTVLHHLADDVLGKGTHKWNIQLSSLIFLSPILSLL